MPRVQDERAAGGWAGRLRCPGRCSASPRNAGRRRGGGRVATASGRTRSDRFGNEWSATIDYAVPLPLLYAQTKNRARANQVDSSILPRHPTALVRAVATEKAAVVVSVDVVGNYRALRGDDLRCLGAVCRPLGHAEDDVRRPTPMLSRSAMNRGSSRTGSNSTAAVTRINEPSRSSKARFSQWKRLSRSDRPR
jgi:hypothetical protein